MPISIAIMLGFLGLALLGYLIFGGIMISAGIATFGGGALLIFGKKDDSLSVDQPVERPGFIRGLGTAVASGGVFAMVGFFLAFVSTLGFICSATVNLVIWFPTIINFIKSLFVAG
jgi:hypothetical protein